MNNFKIVVPDELIAKKPPYPRDSARLMIVDTTTHIIKEDFFRNIGRYVPKSSCMVLNNTRVVPARVVFSKRTGGLVPALFLLNEYRVGDMLFSMLSPKRLSIGERLSLGSVYVDVVSQKENVYLVKPSVSSKAFLDFVGKKGNTPIPPYLKDTQLSERQLRTAYQTIFASKGRSTAAPTASLHFTKRVLNTLIQKGIQQTHITLDVGLGTFAPVGEKELATGLLHKEYFEIPIESVRLIRSAMRKGTPVIAVGTTSLRALESSAKQLLSLSPRSIQSSTQLFVRNPFAFRVVSELVTNFHVPDSSLIYLVDAFLRHKKSPWGITELYARAIQKKFRFFSFGDAMYIR